jgi:hypothetical protein
MKKFYYTLLVLLFSVTAATAQEVFNHLSAGLSLGLGGIGVELATPVTEYMQLRAGMTFVPNFKYNTSLDVEDYANGKVSESEIGQYYTGPTEIDFQGKPNIHDVKLLLDVYPSRHAIFHVTVGAYLVTRRLLVCTTKTTGRCYLSMSTTQPWLPMTQTNSWDWLSATISSSRMPVEMPKPASGFRL